MYVSLNVRDSGAARALPSKVLDFVPTVPKVFQINLSMDASRHAAIRLYESKGLITFEKKLFSLMTEGKPHDKFQIFLHFSPATNE